MGTPESAKKDQEPQKYVEKYYRVRFSARSSVNDTEDVQLSVNGETLVIQREKEVVVPHRFLECADHAEYLQFRQVPNAPRKVVGKVKVYPYERIAEASADEYHKQKTSGTRKLMDDIKRHGFDLNPHDLEG